MKNFSGKFSSNVTVKIRLDPGTHVLSLGHVTGFGHSLHFLSLCECAVSSSLGTVHSCPRMFCCVARSSCLCRCMHLCYILCCVARSLYIHWLCAFMLSTRVSCVNTWLTNFLIRFVFMSCFAHESPSPPIPDRPAAMCT